MGTGSLLITCLPYTSIFLHMSAIVSTNHNSILSIKLQATLFQNVSAKPISAHCTVSTTAPQASIYTTRVHGKRERATLTLLVSISPWQLKGDLSVFLQYR